MVLERFFKPGGGESAFDYFIKGQQAKQQYETNQQMMQARDQQMQMQAQAMQQAELMNPMLLQAQQAGIDLTQAQTTGAINQEQRRGDLHQSDIDQRLANLALTKQQTSASKTGQQAKNQEIAANNLSLEQSRQEQQQQSIIKLGSMAQSVKDFAPEGSQERADYVKSLIPQAKKIGIDKGVLDQIVKDGVTDQEIDQLVQQASSLRQQGSSDLSLDVQKVVMPDGSIRMMQTGKKGAGQMVVNPATGELAIPAPTPAQEKMRVDQIEKQQKYDKARLSTIDKTDNVLNAVNEAIELSGFSTTGVAGKLSEKFGSESRKELLGKLSTIGANLAFSELAEMRQNSPTGGALGGIALGELELLKSTIASLDPDMGDEALDKNLTFIRGKMKKIRGLADGTITVVKTKEDVQSLPPGTVFIDFQTGQTGQKK